MVLPRTRIPQYSRGESARDSFNVGLRQGLDAAEIRLGTVHELRAAPPVDRGLPCAGPLYASLPAPTRAV